MIRRAPRAFTLLEALAALVILTAAAVACLRIGADAAHARLRIDEALRTDREADALFDMVLTGTMGEPRFDEDGGRYVWEGELDGEPFRITRRRETMPNPLVGQVAHAVERVVTVYRYRVEIGERASEFVYRQ